MSPGVDVRFSYLEAPRTVRTVTRDQSQDRQDNPARKPATGLSRRHPHQKRIGFVLGRLLEFGIEALALEVPPTLLALADEDIE
jgi:hypothetical protein